jgi:hypothetical protein
VLKAVRAKKLVAYASVKKSHLKLKNSDTSGQSKHKKDFSPKRIEPRELRTFSHSPIIKFFKNLEKNKFVC